MRGSKQLRKRRAESCLRLSLDLAAVLNAYDNAQSRSDIVRLWKRLSALLERESRPIHGDILHGKGVAEKRAKPDADSLYYDFFYYSDRWCGWRVAALRELMRKFLASGAVK